MEQDKRTVPLSPTFEEEIPGFVEYCFWAEVLHEDGSITIEPYSIFEEIVEP